MANRFWARLTLVALILANLYSLKSVWLGSIVGLFLLLNYGRLAGRLIFPNADRFFQAAFGALTFIGANSIILWISFYLYGINTLVFSSALIATCLTVELCLRRSDKPNNDTAKFNFWHNLKIFVFDLKPKSALVIYFALITINFVQLFFARTDDAISSPWNLLPKSFFYLFIAATLCLIMILLKNKLHRLSLLLVVLHFFLFSSVALIVYKIGYGYDPFLHLAAMKEILIKGFILPKTLYYIGDYSLIIFLHYLTRLPLEFLNQALLPFSFALFFPTSIYYGLTKGLGFEKNYTLIAALAGLFLPISYFIATTPQGLTNLLVLIIIFLSLINKNELSKFFLLFLCFITITIHPLYGVPITLFVLFLTGSELKNIIYKRITQISTALIGTIIFPALFISNSWLNGFKINLHFPEWGVFANKIFITKTYFNFVPDLFHSIGFNLKLFYLGIALFGLILIFKHKSFQHYRTYLFASIILFINYFLTKSTLDFTFSTNQNELQFMARIFELALYFFLPIFLFLIYNFIKHNFEHSNNFLGKLFSVSALVSALAISLYFSYPIKDNYKDSQEYNVTSADISAVHFIAEYAPTDFIVLGNQMLAAAAINEFGFKNYYHGNFYYSIPDAKQDNLYQFYENMVFDAPNRDFAVKAMRLAGVNQAFFVVSDYWSNSKNIVTLAKSTADSWQSIENGKNTILLYKERPIDK